jgi:hypothetical protein
MQQVRHEFYLLIKYNKRAMNNLEKILSHPPLKKIATLLVIMKLEPFTHDLLSED